MNKEIIVYTPLGDFVNLSFIERKVANELIEKKNGRKRGTFNFAFKNRCIYELNDKKVLLDYTNSDYLIQIDNLEQAKKILNNDTHGTIIIHQEKGNVYYNFPVYASFFNNDLLENSEKVQLEIENFFYYKNEKRKYLAVKYKKGILYYFQRATDLYQGSWYHDRIHLDYFLDFDNPKP